MKIYSWTLGIGIVVVRRWKRKCLVWSLQHPKPRVKPGIICLFQPKVMTVVQLSNKNNL